MSESVAKYKNGTKDVWRGWAWNQIEKRAPDAKRVMVLAGDTACDIKHANRRGIACIGVDLNATAVDTFRKKGGVAIQDSIESQLVLHAPCGVILDMLGGIGRNTSCQITTAAFSSRVVVWNGLRGRDPIGGRMSSNPHKRLLKRHIEKHGTVHRGLIAFELWLSHMVIGMMDWNKEKGEHVVDDAQFVDRLTQSLLGHSCPEFYSYRSKDSNQWFDSVAFTSPVAFTSADGIPDKQKLMDLRTLSRLTPKSVRKAAAAKAIQTMRGGPVRPRKRRAMKR